MLRHRLSVEAQLRQDSTRTTQIDYSNVNGLVARHSSKILQYSSTILTVSYLKGRQ